jgi:hypothetical protein
MYNIVRKFQAVFRNLIRIDFVLLDPDSHWE